MDKDFRFTIDGISEDDLELLLTLSKEEVSKIIKNRGVTTTSCSDNLKKIDKDYIRYNKKLYSMLDNKMCIGLFYMLLNRNYCYYNDLFRAKQVNWSGYISKIKKLGLIKHTLLGISAKYYYSCKTCMSDYHISRMKIYNLSSKGEEFFNNEMRNYINDNVDIDFIKAIEEQKEEYEFLVNAMGIEENIPPVLSNYLIMKNKKTFSKKVLDKKKQQILNDKDLMEYVERYKIEL